jgi:sugar O-acyltransferase (sialic acid O-acetyltransferase NeuD family)
VGFMDDDYSLHGEDCCGIKVVGGRETLEKNPDAFVLAVPGNPGNYLRRRDIIQGLNLKKSRFATIVHPSAVVAPDATVGYNTLVMSSVVISCGVEIGNHCIVLPNTVIAHDSGIGDYCCIGSNAAISGNVVIGRNCYVGSGANIRDGVRIGERSLVGLGSNVISDFGDDVTVVGNPARVMRKSTI